MLYSGFHRGFTFHGFIIRVLKRIQEYFMFGFIKGKKCGWRKSLPLLTYFFTVLAFILPISVPDALAQTAATEGWYRLRTNSVPYQPQNVALDATGGLWVSASDGTEYTPGVWYRPPDALAGPSFQHFTNDRRNNLLSTAYNPPIEKPQLNATGIVGITRLAGWEGLICGASAVYTGLAQVLNEYYGKVVWPIGPMKK